MLVGNVGSQVMKDIREMREDVNKYKWMDIDMLLIKR